jgi:3-phenylpropionate/cinnamic acid dioxygenase small subunit
MDDITLTIIEISIGIVIESVLLGLIFQMISSKSEEKLTQTLQDEMNNIEKQNKFQLEQILKAIETSRTDTLNQIKESAKHQDKTP